MSSKAAAAAAGSPAVVIVIDVVVVVVSGGGQFNSDILAIGSLSHPSTASRPECHGCCDAHSASDHRAIAVATMTVTLTRLSHTDALR